MRRALTRVGANLDDQRDGAHEARLLGEDWDGPKPAGRVL